MKAQVNLFYRNDKSLNIISEGTVGDIVDLLRAASKAEAFKIALYIASADLMKEDGREDVHDIIIDDLKNKYPDYGE